MKKYLTVIAMLIYGYSSAQHLLYNYDESGNRIQRKYFTTRMSDPSATKDSSAFVESQYGIKVFPNPTSDDINVSVKKLEEGESAVVQLLDQQGKILSEKSQKAKQEVFNLSSFKQGIYYVKIFIRKESVSYKIIKL